MKFFIKDFFIYDKKKKKKKKQDFQQFHKRQNSLWKTSFFFCLTFRFVFMWFFKYWSFARTNTSVAKYWS